VPPAKGKYEINVCPTTFQALKLQTVSLAPRSASSPS
jgi:hypothetical protein